MLRCRVLRLLECSCLASTLRRLGAWSLRHLLRCWLLRSLSAWSLRWSSRCFLRFLSCMLRGVTTGVDTRFDTGPCFDAARLDDEVRFDTYFACVKGDECSLRCCSRGVLECCTLTCTLWCVGAWSLRHSLARVDTWPS